MVLVNENKASGASVDRACADKIYIDKAYISEACVVKDRVNKAYVNKACIGKDYTDGGCGDGTYTDKTVIPLG